MWVAAGIAGNERHLERQMADDALPKTTERFEAIERKVPPIAPSRLLQGHHLPPSIQYRMGRFL